MPRAGREAGSVGIDLEERVRGGGKSVVEAVEHGAAVRDAGLGFAAIAGGIGCMDCGVDAHFGCVR